MNPSPVVMVQISDYEWTLEALHCACILARSKSAKIALVHMIPVQHPALLGTDLGSMNFTYQAQTQFSEYQTTIEDYGVAFTPLLFQYDSLAEAIAQAAAHVNAHTVFAKIPESAIPFWARFQRWSLRRQLTAQDRPWIQHPVYDIETAPAVMQAVSKISGFAEHHAHS